MKKVYKLLLLFPLLFPSHIRAQGNIEPFLLRDWAPHSAFQRGAGIGVYALCDTLSFH